MQTQNRYREALAEGGNLVGISSAVALSLATFSPLPLLVGLVAEAAYLLFVPDSEWYSRRLARRHDVEIDRRREALKAQLLPTLRTPRRRSFQRLEEIRGEIEAQAGEDSPWFPQVLRKLDFLLEKYLQFAEKEVRYRAYLQSVLTDLRAEAAEGARPNLRLEAGGRSRVPGKPGPRPNEAPEPDPAAEPGERWIQRASAEIQAQYGEQIAGLRAQQEREGDPHTRAVLQKRADVLERRRQFIEKMARILLNLGHQLKLLEETFGLINDELRARSPEQVLVDIDDVVTQANTMTGVLEEVASFEQMLRRLSA